MIRQFGLIEVLQMGLTGVEMEKLLAATNEITALIGRSPASRVVNALNAKARAS